MSHRRSTTAQAVMTHNNDDDDENNNNNNHHLFTHNMLYKKAVLSQRWPRDARYISRSWAVVETWPFEIMQEGGDRHLEFIRIENSAIRSTVPENHTL